MLQYDVDFEDFGDDERTMKVGDVDFSVGGIKIILHRCIVINILALTSL